MSKEKEFIQKYEEDLKNQKEVNEKLIEMVEALHIEVKSLSEQKAVQEEPAPASGTQDEPDKVSGLQDEGLETGDEDQMPKAEDESQMQEAEGEEPAPQEEKKPTLEDVKALAAELGYEVTLTPIVSDDDSEEGEEGEQQEEPAIPEEPVKPMEEDAPAGQQESSNSQKESLNEESIFTELASSFQEPINRNLKE